MSICENSIQSFTVFHSDPELFAVSLQHGTFWLSTQHCSVVDPERFGEYPDPTFYVDPDPNFT